MRDEEQTIKGEFRGILARLRKDRRGNTIAIMAAALIPLLGFSGSAVDMARLYLVKSRLQQACDAGVLAGRRAMTDTSLANTTLDATAKSQADSFFFNNFTTGAYGTTDLVFAPRKASAGGSASANAVSADSSAMVPMVVMKFFGFGSQKVAVACQARFDVADTDVLFVLDTTGSMACAPADTDTACNNYVGATSTKEIKYTRPASSNGVAGYAGTTSYGVEEKANSRIEALRKAVLSFYDTFKANADTTTKVRYGFVTYSSSVNVGKAIRDVIPSSLVGSLSSDTASYQSRRVNADYTISYSDSVNNRASSACSGVAVARNPSASLTYASNGTATESTYVWDSRNNRCLTRASTYGPQWRYDKISYNVAGLVAGNILLNPTKVRGQTMRWMGCVETMVQQPGQSTFTTTNLPFEINPDITPSGSQRWFPHMQDLQYRRNNSNTDDSVYYTNGDAWNVAPGYGSDEFAKNSNGTDADGDSVQKAGSVACGKPAKRLDEMTREEVRSYVYADDFVPLGGTYHDIGMIWGTRLISPTGPWGGDTAAWTGRNAPNRVIIFLTDGDMSPTLTAYSMYGREGYDGRVGNGSTDATTLTDLHNKRFLAACAAAKARNIDVWTVAIDSASSTTLDTCATVKAQALFTNSGSDLASKFEAIARKLAMLRISR